MTIPALGRQIKRFLGQIPADALLALAILLVASMSFMLGILAGKDMAQAKGKGIWVSERPVEAANLTAGAREAPMEPIAQGGQYVASKNGEAYYLPFCGGASRIKDENKVWFNTKEEAEAKGYRPAKTCKGI